ncbi:MAG: repeat-containing protein [Pedosphaera sp.]|nr:repeat-containing protein [Pedosphaera sp.]
MKASSTRGGFSGFVAARLRRRWIQLALVGLILGVGFLVFRRHEDEPEYAGKPLSDWFRQYYRNASPSGSRSLEPLPNLEAGDAIKAIGTNALPYLVKEALSEERDTAMRTNFFLILRVIPRSWGLPGFVSRETIHLEAANAICQIKPPAGIILPQLEAALNGTNIQSHLMALYILGGIGENGGDALPYLVSALRETNGSLVGVAANSAGKLGTRARGVVPMLLTTLQAGKTGYLESSEVARVLGCIGPDAAPAIPRLKELSVKARSTGLWPWYAKALCQIDAGQTEALDSLVEVLRDKKARAAYASRIQSLGEIGPNARAAIPVLVECVGETDELVWPVAARALARIGAPKSMFVPQVEEKLKSDAESARVEAIMVLLEIDPENQALHSIVNERLRDKSAYAIKTVEFLERAGPVAKWAAPLLRGKLSTRAGPLRKAIIAALRRIQPASIEVTIAD